MERSPEGKASSPSSVSILFSSRISGLPPAADLFQHLVNAVELLLGVRMADVQHVQEQVGMHRFFQRRLEAGDEIVRQVANKSDRVGQQHLRAPLEPPGARLGVERGEQLVVGIRAGGGQRVEQRALAGVGVADDADGEMIESCAARPAGSCGPGSVDDLGFEI